MPQISPLEIDYELPENRIAKYSRQERDQSLLLVSDEKGFSKKYFSETAHCLNSGSLLVVNNARVIHARFIFRRDTGARIEVFLLEPIQPSSYEQVFNETSTCAWKCMIGNARKWKSDILTGYFELNGNRYKLQAGRKGDNEVVLNWEGGAAFSQVVAAYGTIPLPPYIKRDAEECDKSDYQTVFSSIPGSVAAPTAGLHFTKEMITGMKKQGFSFEELTLHVGAGTFLPVQSSSVTEHVMHSEKIIIPRRFIEKISMHEKDIVAVGTTSVRTMESLAAIAMKMKNRRFEREDLFSVGQWETYEHDFAGKTEVCAALLHYLDKYRLGYIEAETSLMIVPGFRFLFTDALITNFHQPRSTLLLLVSAFMGEKWKEMYRFAMDNGYRFLSYGDACLIKP